MTAVAIHQPNYLPWLGYFRKVARSDLFVFYDNVQMPMGKSYVTRSQVKSPDGARWLTVPTEKSGTPGLIKDTPIVAGNWPRKHMGSLRSWYAGSPWLSAVEDLLQAAFHNQPGSIADLNIEIIEGLSRLMGIDRPRFIRASAMKHGVTGAASIVPVLQELGAKLYLTGKGSGSLRHLNVEALGELGIETRFLDTELPVYEQRHGPFESGLSAIDALLNLGPDGVLEIIA